MRICFPIIAILLCLINKHLSADINNGRLELYYGVAEGNYIVGDLVGAENSIEQILRIEPNYPPALNLKSNIMLDKGRADLALISAERASGLDPNNLKYKLTVALILGNLQRREEASKLIDSVLIVAPAGSEDAIAAKQLLGLLLMADGEWDSAVDTFKDIYSTNSSDNRGRLKLMSEAYVEKARAAMNEGNTEVLIEAMEQAIEVLSLIHI